MISLTSAEGSEPNKMWWASASALHTSVGSLAGVVGLISVIKRDALIGTLSCFSSLPGLEIIPEEDYFVPGLQNHGSNCFFNVILQALASCSHFRPYLEKLMEESESLAIHEISEHLSLTEALDAMLLGLQMLSEAKEVLDPIMVMNEMANHVPSFNMEVQQDASEALCRLMDSIRAESLRCYVLNRSPLATPTASEGRIRSPQVANEQINVQERWQKHFLGPFDGLVGSIVTCRTCSSQLSLDFTFFATLVVTPVPTNGSTIMRGCNLFDCLRHFVSAHIENQHHCSCCWHAAAASYLSSKGRSQGEIDQVKACMWGDSCECKSLSGLRDFPWADIFCRIVKSTRIARSPKILCIELARVAMVEQCTFKLQGHISFPLVLDLSSFMLTRFGVNMQANRLPWWVQQPVQQQQNPREVAEAGLLYRLVSVTEHSGPLGNGHFTVYRSVRTEQPEEGHSQAPGQVPLRWFRISDTEVECVSEDNVLASEACILYYERIPAEEV